MTDRFDVLLCFTPADPDGAALMDEWESALRDAGLSVLRDTAVDDSADALANSRAVLVLCSRADRALVVAPGADGEHAVDPRNLPALVGLVLRKVADVRCGRPARMVGRYRELLAVHRGLQARPVLMVRGLPGVGKTTLAEEYARLFQDTFDGGVLRLGPFGQHAPEDVLSQFHLALARAAGDRLGADLAGVDFDRLRDHVAERIGADGRRVLVLVDDVPAGLPPDVLERLILPTSAVCTVLVSRMGNSPWDVSALDLAGLSPGEGLGLFSEYRAPADDAEREAVLRLVEHCGGHPITLRANALARPRQGIEPLVSCPDTAPQAIRGLLAGCGPVAAGIVRLGGLLAPVPFPLGIAHDVLGGEDGFAEAVGELEERGVASLVDGGLRLQPLVAEVARAGIDPGDLPESAATSLLRLLSDDRTEYRDFLLQHARALAERTSAVLRIRLLRSVAAAHERHRDFFAAGEIHAVILSTEGVTSTDFATAARVEIACGLSPEAVRHARHALLSAADDDERYAARLIAAQAFDCQGDYDAGDRTFWHEFPCRGETRLPVIVAHARALRLRGRAREAIASLDAILPELHGPPPEDLLLEYARALLLDDRPGRAREVAAEVIAAFHATGRVRHFQCVEAELLWAEATITLELRDVHPDRSAAVSRELEARYGRCHGSESPTALTAAALAGRALLLRGQPERALTALSATERTVLRVVGGENRLRYRIRHGIALAHGQLRDFGRQAEILEEILQPQIRLLGSTHPETLESRLDLGLALAFSGRDQYRRATELVDGAADDIVATLGHATELSEKAIAAKRVLRGKAIAAWS
ncbi:ATP-binding protein [Amycolatopsis sp. EV170708-02-1]|uniref:ATP-binding protein n=1 Tax=Amycolatopsis sp. EV170708-02-1 TaxID=2919322 RepID=UPI001F0BA52D|nr:ATP-binding protein [Amycolatopsis sp. EV170708-02-1]UMP03544.1 ATP-binding protein [Amycolatopsis sp. EV170708-02-1]